MRGRSYSIVQLGLGLTMLPRLASCLQWSFCLSLPLAKIIGVSHLFYAVLDNYSTGSLERLTAEMLMMDLLSPI